MKIFIGIILGILIAVAVTLLSVAIGCAVNGLGFGEQICEWFGNNAPAIGETVEQVAESITETPIA